MATKSPSNMANWWKLIKSKVTPHERKKTADGFSLIKGAQHGFPECPTAFDYDAKLQLLAIGTAMGVVKILGAAGVELDYTSSNKDQSVCRLHFIPNQGRLVVMLESGAIQLLEINTKDGVSVVENVKTLTEFQKSTASAVVQSGENALLLVATADGDVSSVGLPALNPVEALGVKAAIANSTFDAIPADKKEALGCAVSITQNPVNRDQVLLGFSSGSALLYSLATKTLVQVFYLAQGLTHIDWKSEDSFVASYDDGSYLLWKTSQTEAEKPTIPYGPFPCEKISKIFVRDDQTGGNQLIIFAGGLPKERYNDHHTISIQKGEKHDALDFPTDIVDFVTIGDDADALLVLLKNQLIAVDLSSDKYPEMSAPYLMSLHAPITAFRFYENVSGELIQELQDAGHKPTDKRPFGGYSPKYSQREWPIKGGQALFDQPARNDLLITAHGDGALRFWQASGLNLRLIHKLDAPSRYYHFDSDSDYPDESADVWPPFRKYGVRTDTIADQRLHVEHFAFDPNTKVLAVAGSAGQVIVYRFCSEYGIVSFHTLKVPLVGEEYEYVWRGTQALDSRMGNLEAFAGFQGQLNVQLDPPAQITALSLHPEWNLVAVGTGHGFALVDFKKKKSVLSTCTFAVPEGSEVHKTLQQRLEGAGDTIRRSLRRLPRPALHMTFGRSSNTYTVNEEGGETDKSQKSTIPTSITTDDIVDHTSTVKPVALPVLIESQQETTAEEAVEEKKVEEKPAEVIEEKEVVTESVKTEDVPQIISLEERKESMNEVVVSFESEILPPKSPQPEEHRAASSLSKTASEKDKKLEGEAKTEAVPEAKKERVYDIERTTVRSLLLTEGHILNETSTTPAFLVGLNNGKVMIYTLDLYTEETQSFEDIKGVLAKEVHLKHGAPVVAMAVLEIPAAKKAAASATAPPASPAPSSQQAVSPAPPAETAAAENVEQPVAPPAEAVVAEVNVEASTSAATTTEEKKVESEPRSPTPSAGAKVATGPQHKLLVVSEEQLKIFDLPSLKAMKKWKLKNGTKVRYAVISEGAASNEQDGTGATEKHVTVITDRGDVEVFAFPVLNRVLKQQLLEKEKVGTKLILGKNGHGVVQTGANEVQQFAVTKEAIYRPACIVSLPEGARPVPVKEAEKAAEPVEAPVTSEAVVVPVAVVIETVEVAAEPTEGQQVEEDSAPVVETIILHDAPAATTVVEVIEQTLTTHLPVGEDKAPETDEEVVISTTVTTTTITSEVTENGDGDSVMKSVVIEELVISSEPASQLNESAMEEGNITSDTIVDHTEEKIHQNGDGHSEDEHEPKVHNLEEKLKNLEMDPEVNLNEETAAH